MTPEQRYFLDVTGYLYLKNVLSGEELKKAQEAVDRYINTPPEDLPPGFINDPLGLKEFHRYHHAFAFDKSLEALTRHPVTWPIITELTGGKPRLLRGNLMVDSHKSSFHTLHSTREGRSSAETPRYYCKNGRIYCDLFVVFWYFTDVYPGDGGLLVVPGSHKSEFKRPGGAFYDEEWDKDAYRPEGEMPPGLLNITPQAGDVVIITELLTHGSMYWKPEERDRRFLVLRYMPQYLLAHGGSYPEAIVGRVSPETRELMEVARYEDSKAIVNP